MKKVSIIVLVFIMANIVFAHRQHVHQYISVQAYKLLKMQLGGDLRIMKDKIGGLDSYYAGSGPFQLGFITTGAWREDEEDVVYGYSKSNPPTLTSFSGSVYDFIAAFGGLSPDGFVSSTHFWYADEGDNLQTTMRANIIVLGIDNVMLFTIPNAYQKMTAFAYGGYDLNLDLILYGFPTNADGSGACATQRAIVTFHYNSLIDLYKNKKYLCNEGNLANRSTNYL
ncbi:hypothetical protein ABRY23_03130 [Melioribacteraceae bacterium 4301-Me]|uniref:hypothetical protein n=1 Tax=Pyranulibacter aquaticus TaxID=3163344 RepID=UPI003598E8B4